MIISLAFGTFVQQLITYEVMAARQSEKLGNIPRSEEWVTQESTSAFSKLKNIRLCGH